MLSSMFSFMKQNKHRRHSSNDGIYLSDISTIDPEVAALYFNSNEKKKNGKFVSVSQVLYEVCFLLQN